MMDEAGRAGREPDWTEGVVAILCVRARCEWGRGGCARQEEELGPLSRAGFQSERGASPFHLLSGARGGFEAKGR